MVRYSPASERPSVVSFSDATKQAVRQRARGICECSANTSCPHYGPCKSPGTEFHQKQATVVVGEEMRACQLVCKACHERIHKDASVLGRM